MDCGEIGRGAYGTVNNMLHKESNINMAVKVRIITSNGVVIGKWK